MPIYEYSCKSCLKQFEELVRGDQQIQCPQCGSGEVQRKMSVCGFTSSSGFIASTPSSCSGCTRSNCSGCSSLTLGK